MKCAERIWVFRILTYLNRVKKLALFFAFFSALIAFGQAPEPHLFRVVHYEMESLPGIDFLSLSEIYGYQYSEEGYEKVIERAYLDSNVQGGLNYHELSPAKRALFLERCGIKESDCLYLIDLHTNQVERLEVQSLKASAFLNVNDFGSPGPFPEYYYMIGLEIPSEQISKEGNSHYGQALAMFGPENPFKLNGLQQIEFDSIPCPSIPNFSSYFPKSDTTCRCFHYEYDSLSYYVHEVNSIYLYPSARNVLVLHQNDSSLVQNLEFRDSEGSYLPRLNVKGRANTSPQWTGEMLKDKGPVLLGFIGYSFGCERLHFTDSTQEPIYILCDNRH